MIDHHPNIEFRLYNPYSKRIDNMAMRALLNLGEFGRVNHRMHNKCLIIDNQAAIVGGRNQADEYFGWHEAANFRDLELICFGQVVPQISQCFDRFWNDHWTYPEDFVANKKAIEEYPEGYEAWVSTHTKRFLHEAAEARQAAWHALAERAFDAKIQILADLPANDQDGHFESEGAKVLEAGINRINRSGTKRTDHGICLFNSDRRTHCSDHTCGTTWRRS
ncbi:MAG: hypothetical protein ISQ74_05465 [Puniceicoccaceae bacterium]|nr:hypothetical protein [Puniceicoccaceae bacterium]